MRYIRLLFPLFIFLFIQVNNAHAQCENRCLDFNGVDNYIEVANPLISGSNFTIEIWFLSNNTSTDQFHRIIGWDNLALADSSGFLRFYDGTWQRPVAGPDPNIRDGNWHCVSVIYDGANTTVLLDGASFLTIPASPGLANLAPFIFLGAKSVLTGEYWRGKLDEFRIWDVDRTPSEINEYKQCLPNNSTSGLLLYWRLDQGNPGMDNSNPPIMQAIDVTGNGNDGILNNFTLTGNTSNFDCSGNTGLIYPNLNNIELQISDYPNRIIPLIEICNGDPAHFCLYQDGETLPNLPNVSYGWEYNDGNGWLPLSNTPFNGSCFAVPSGNLTLDCSNSADGFVRRKFRAVSTVMDAASGEICEQLSEDYDLKICCPIGPAFIQLTPDDPLCEGEQVDVTACLNSADLFVTIPGEEVDIEWYFNGNSLGFLDQTCINHSFTAPAVTAPSNFCFEAKVTNCGGKSATFSACLNVDPEPVCGSIMALPTPDNLTLVSNTPHLVYEICPGNDASLAIDPNDPFQFCTPQWQYSFDEINWTNVGFGNSQQNTNILPSSQWPTGATSIFYRIQCNPLSNPSGCEPCFSEKVEIQLKAAPQPNSITGINQECIENLPVNLSVNAPIADNSYTWLCNGLDVGTGTSYNATQNACYWLEESNGCQVVESPKFCLQVCEIQPVITCPLTSNDCACLDEPITLSACMSSSTCGDNSGFSYQWFIDGVSNATTSCTITDTPPANGSTYEVVITDSATGCTASASTFIKPCEKP